MSDSESSSGLAASTTAVSFICFILISYSYWFGYGGWGQDIMYWQAVQGFLTILLTVFVFVPTLKRVSNKCIPKRQVRRSKRIRDRFHQTLVKLLPQHVSSMMILAALVMPYMFGMVAVTNASGLSLFSPLAGMFSFYFQIDGYLLDSFLPYRASFFMQLGSTTIGFLALGILWLQLLYAHEVLRYVEGRITKKRVMLIGLIILGVLVPPGILGGIAMMLGLASSAFIPFPVSIFIGFWLVQRKDRLLSKGEAKPVGLVTYLIHEEEVSVPIIYVLESRLKKLLGRN
ncbi:MAG: hypothetical protein RTU09_05620 [Candidatus Thorarchaeota archaeon]